MGGTEIASAYVSLLASARGMGRDIERQAGGEVSGAGRNLGRGFSRAFGAVAGLAAAAGIGAFVKASVDSLARIERINTQTETVIASTGSAAGVTAAHVENLAGALENMTATEAESIQEGANFLLTFKNIRNEAGKGNDIFDQTVRAMTDLSRATGTDMSAASLQLGKALNDPITGMNALRRVGIGFTAEQQEMIKSLVAAGDVMGAQKIVLGELESQFGGSAEAYAKTTEGQVELAKHAIGTLGETMTAGLLPILGNVASFAANALNAAAEMWPGFQSRLAGFFAPVRDLIVSVWAQIPGAIEAARPYVEAAIGWFRDLASGVVALVTSQGAQQALAAVMETMRVIASNLVAALQSLWPTIKRVGITARDLFVEIKPFLVDALRIAFDTLVAVLQGAAPLLKTLANFIAGVVRWMYDWQDVLVPLAAGLAAMVATVVAYRLAVSAVIAVQRAWIAILVATRTAIAVVRGAMLLLNLAMIANPIGLIVVALVGLVAVLVVAWKKSETFRDIVIGAWEAMKAAGIAVFHGIKAAIEWAMSAIRAVFNFYLNAFRLVWTTIFGAIKKGVELYLNGVRLYITTVVRAIVGIFNGMRALVGLVVGFFVNIKNGIVGQWNALIGFLVGLPGRVTSALSGMWNVIKDGFRSALNTIIGWWNNFSLTIDIPDAIPGLPNEWTIRTPNIPMLAKGGIVDRPTLAVIGEAGPEAVVPLAQYNRRFNAGAVDRGQGDGGRGPALTAADLGDMKIEVTLGVDRRSAAELVVAGQRYAVEMG